MAELAAPWQPATFTERQTIVGQLTLRPSFKTIGKITAQFLRRASISSVESDDGDDDPTPWMALWQAYNPWHGRQLLQPLPGPADPVDIYVDSVRLLPEHVLLARVTCEVTGQPPGAPRLRAEAMPLPDSPARSPAFRCRLQAAAGQLGPAACLVVQVPPGASHRLQVVGLEIGAEAPSHVGSCIFPLFHTVEVPLSAYS
jgi:hypothetical protein